MQRNICHDNNVQHCPRTSGEVLLHENRPLWKSEEIQAQLVYISWFCKFQAVLELPQFILEFIEVYRFAFVLGPLVGVGVQIMQPLSQM